MTSGSTDSEQQETCWEVIVEKFQDFLPDVETQLHTLVAFSVHLIVLLAGEHEFKFL